MADIKYFSIGAMATASALGAIFFLTGAKAPPRHEKFDEITVGRINIVEPNGTNRIIISNMAQFPGDFMKGKEGERSDRKSFAGMLFVNDEGTENGGLIQKGSISADGKISSGLSLTFDRFRQDQTLQLINNDSEFHQQTGIQINDVPLYSKTSMEDVKGFVLAAEKLPDAQQQAFWQKLSDQGRLSNNRIWLGNTGDKGSSLQLKDAQGRVRMMLLVTADGKAEIQMLDAQGSVKKTITPTSKE